MAILSEDVGNDLLMYSEERAGLARDLGIGEITPLNRLGVFHLLFHLIYFPLEFRLDTTIDQLGNAMSLFYVCCSTTGNYLSQARAPEVSHSSL